MHIILESICLLCRIGNDKTVYSKFQIVSLVDFDINISVELWHVTNIGSVLYALLTLRSSPFITSERHYCFHSFPVVDCSCLFT
jgi:hypothetical protein